MTDFDKVYQYIKEIFPKRRNAACEHVAELILGYHRETRDGRDIVEYAKSVDVEAFLGHYAAQNPIQKKPVDRVKRAASSENRRMSAILNRYADQVIEVIHKEIPSEWKEFKLERFRSIYDRLADALFAHEDKYGRRNYFDSQSWLENAQAELRNEVKDKSNTRGAK